jgi:AraC-like DNA-binding protein
VEAIARRTGYGTNASLSKAFKREFGTSPGQYREGKGSVVVSPPSAGIPGGIAS